MWLARGHLSVRCGCSDVPCYAPVQKVGCHPQHIQRGGVTRVLQQQHQLLLYCGGGGVGRRLAKVLQAQPRTCGVVLRLQRGTERINDGCIHVIGLKLRCVCTNTSHQHDTIGIISQYKILLVMGVT